MRLELPPLPPIKQRIFEAVRRRPGISAEELRGVVWADDPNGGPEDRKVLHVHVSQLNHRLAAYGIMVRSQGGGYRIRSAPCP
jgi:DNA-binding response OmpR family regulator